MSTDQSTPVFETERLILRRFTPQDTPALLSIHRDREVNTFRDRSAVRFVEGGLSTWPL